MTHPFDYSGPGGHYVPPHGMTTDGMMSTLVAGTTDPTPTYANLVHFHQQIDGLETLVNSFIISLENALKNVSLAVTSNPNDQKLQAAHEVLWPTTLGNPPSFISYSYYNSLRGITSAAASYIRKSFEKAARGSTGTNAIDILPIVQITNNEISLVKNFVNQNASQLGDASQRRTVEVLQDWVDQARTQIENLQQVFTQPPHALPSTDINSISSQQSSQSQALFQVNLNKLNQKIVRELGVLKKSFDTFASVFYNNHLGPAIHMRTNVVTSLNSSLPPTIYGEIEPSNTNLNDNLTNLLADQYRRTSIYATQVSTLVQDIQQRDSYRFYIGQLSSAGSPIPTGASGTMVPTGDTPAQAAYFQSVSTTSPSYATAQFVAPHSELSGLSSPTAHSQYLLKAGDALSGNLTLTNNALVDGITPSTHAHTGTDGSTPIHGANIIAGTVGAGAVDSTIQPSVPTQLAVTQQVIDSSNGGIDLIISWYGDPSLTYEVQIAKAP